MYVCNFTKTIVNSEGLVRKPCHGNNGAAIYVARATTPHSAFSNVHTTVEYLNKNVSIGQLLQHIPNSIAVCAWSRPKRRKKTCNKEV